MKKVTAPAKVIWAVDALSENKKIQFNTFKTLAKLVTSDEATIEPVAVLSADQLKIPPSVFREQKKPYELEAEGRLKAWVKELKDPRVTSPTLLVHDIYSSHATVDVLLRYARETGADFIAVATHNRKGIERLFFGSFAETLMLKSEIPILVVNPSSLSAKKISNILFPTDFSTVSQEVFERVLLLAKDLNAKVTLYFKFEYVLPETIALMKQDERFKQFQETDREEKRKTASEWVGKAKRMMVKVDVILDEKPFFVSEGILKAGKKSKADLIAMASNSGALASTIIGSVARQVARTATVPVWVIHPVAKAARVSTNVSEPGLKRRLLPEKR